MATLNRPSHPLSGKPFDIRERLELFAADVVVVGKFLHDQGGIARELAAQLASAGLSAASNTEEADDGSSRKDFIAKQRIALREVKETRIRLKVLRRAELLGPSHDPLIAEARELVLILSTIIRHAERGSPR